MLADSWCAERSFLTKTISSSYLGEYRFCYVLWNRRIHILIVISCVKTLYVPQNQSFFPFAPAVWVFLVTAIYSFVDNYVHRMVIKVVLCVGSLLWTSRYVLIDISNVTHFLCCNPFVMLYLTLSAISANVLEIRLPITDIYPFSDG